MTQHFTMSLTNAVRAEPVSGLRIRRRARSGVAAVVAFALAAAPMTPQPWMTAAIAQTAPASSPNPAPQSGATATPDAGPNRYGLIPQAPPPSPKVPDPAEAAKYGSQLGTMGPLSPGQKLPDLGDSSQTM